VAREVERRAVAPGDLLGRATGLQLLEIVEGLNEVVGG